jgi:predicted metalloprotease with PDZ domain
MLARCCSAIAVGSLLLTLLLSGRAQTAQTSAPTIAFTVGMPKPHTHMFEVEMHVKRGPGSPAKDDILVMPVWTPGSYLIREFERQVQDFTASDAAGTPIQWQKINKNSWRVATSNVPEWRVRYRVYANDLTARTSHLNSDHAFWNNATLLMFLDGSLTAPATLQILAPQPWKIATSLPAVPTQKNTFRAENFDILYDSPVEVGNFKTIAFDVRGVPHRLVIDGAGNYDPDRLRVDVKKIVEAEVAIMGEIPYPDYTFFLHLTPDDGDGIEHLNSTSLLYPRFSFKPEQRYQGFWTLVSHEFFHLWNVKRIRPDALGPFDYSAENYTKLLWVAEGITSYYENVALVRAGLFTDRDFLATMAREIQRLQNRPGRLVMSVEDASFDAWIKRYRQDENSVNSQVDYYNKGAILGMLLDLEIRKLSKGSKSLDDVMRYLYTEFYKKNRNYTPEDFQKACELMAGTSLDAFFNRYVQGREELDFDAALAAAGLRLDTTGGQSKPAEKAYLGADVVQQGERLVVQRVLAGSPAYEQGLNTGDQILALNNVRATKEFFDARIDEKRPGDPVSLTIFRADDLSTLLIKLGGRVQAEYKIVPLANVTPEQKSVYEAWMKKL